MVRRTTSETHPTAEAAAAAAADVVESALRSGRLRNFGVATGSSPSPLYRELARRGLDLSVTNLFALDECVGLPAGHPEGYRAVVEREVAVPLGVPLSDVHLPDGADPEAIDGPRSESMPASVLRDHAGVSWFLDEGAASQLAHRRQYRAP